jgi:hypothetical protein
MPTEYRLLRIIVFKAIGNERQTYEVAKHVQDLKIYVNPFSKTRLKSHIRFYIPNGDIYQTDHQDGHKGGTSVAIMSRPTISPFCGSNWGLHPGCNPSNIAFSCL